MAYTDPDNPSADTSTSDPNAGVDWFAQNAPSDGGHGSFTPVTDGTLTPISNVQYGYGLTNGYSGTDPTKAGVNQAVPNQTTGQPQGAGSSYGPTSNWADPSTISSYFQSRGVTPAGTSPQYWADQWNQWGKTDPNYFWTRLQSADEFVQAGLAQPYGGGGSGSGAVGSYTTPDKPGYLSNPYAPQTWSEQFSAPTLADLQNTPGYQSGVNAYLQGIQRGQAAKGSILSGGAVRALGRDASDYTNQKYQQLYGNAFQAYQQKYGQFADQNNNALAARQLNDNEFNQGVTNSLNQYLTRYGAYQDLIKNNLGYANLGLQATQAGAPTGTGTGA